MQPIYIDDEGTPRFRANPIVRWLLEAKSDLNEIAALPGITREEHAQFAQLIGYSVCGFGDLSHVPKKLVKKADRKANELLTEAKKAE